MEAQNKFAIIIRAVYYQAYFHWMGFSNLNLDNFADCKIFVPLKGAKKWAAVNDKVRFEILFILSRSLLYFKVYLCDLLTNL